MTTHQASTAAHTDTVGVVSLYVGIAAVLLAGAANAALGFGQPAPALVLLILGFAATVAGLITGFFAAARLRLAFARGAWVGGILLSGVAAFILPL